MEYVQFPSLIPPLISMLCIYILPSSSVYAVPLNSTITYLLSYHYQNCLLRFVKICTQLHGVCFFLFPRAHREVLILKRREARGRHLPDVLRGESCRLSNPTTPNTFSPRVQGGLVAIYQRQRRKPAPFQFAYNAQKLQPTNIIEQSSFKIQNKEISIEQQ